jgi:2-polyprenyl-6-hydroxyphenyl methylase/3-demethylubiquinone-9 3-methyltransferase
MKQSAEPQGVEARFAFGKNWQAFAREIDPERVDQAMDSLRASLQVVSLQGKRFLDLGCGSGLFSLAAYRLGAEVISVDFDQDSVRCTEQVRDQFGDGERDWQVGQGSILDERFVSSLGPADVVYCWGVVHHTGAMNRAIELVASCVRPGGSLCLAVYNDQGGASRRWLAIKRLYHRLPDWLQPAWVFLIAGYYEIKFALIRLLKGRNPLPFNDWQQKKRDRGMSVWHDWVDWIGGLPFEVASPEQVIVPLRKRGFVLEQLKTVRGGWGCNEYVFSRHAPD